MTQFIPEVFKLILTMSFFIIFFLFNMYLLSTKFGIWNSIIQKHLFSVLRKAQHILIHLIHYQASIDSKAIYIKTNKYEKAAVHNMTSLAFTQVSHTFVMEF